MRIHVPLLDSLEQAVDGLEEPIGLARLIQARMPSKCRRINCATSFIGSTFERITLVHHCLRRMRPYDVRLLASEDLPQLLPVQPGARRANCWSSVCQERIELAALRSTEPACVFQQRPAQPLEARIELLLPAAHLVTIAVEA